MRNLSPSTIVSLQASLRITKGEAKALSQKISGVEKLTLEDYKALGQKLREIKAQVRHGEWGPTLEELRISSQRASDAMLAAEWAYRFPQAQTVNELLAEIRKLKDETAGSTGDLDDSQDSEGDEPQGDGDSEIPASGDLEGQVEQADAQKPEPEPARDLTKDPDGNDLPIAVLKAYEHQEKVKNALGLITAAAKAVEALEALPDGAADYLVRQEETRLSAIERSRQQLRVAYMTVNKHAVRPGNTFACDGYGEAGCTGDSSCRKCKGRLYVVSPLHGEQKPPEPRQWRGR